MQRLSHEVEHLVNGHREATEYGETIAEWEALDKRLAQTEIDRLLQERYEIEQQILDLSDPAG